MRKHLILASLVTMNTLGLFLIQLLVFFQFGTGAMTDAFMASLTLPQALMVIVAVALTSSLIPHFAGENKTSQKEDGWFVLLALGTLFLVVSIILSLTASYWVPLIFPGFSPDVSAMCVELSRIQVFSMLFTVCSGVAAAIYQARDQFILVAAKTCVVTFLTIVAMDVVLPRYGLVAAAWVLLLSSMLQLAVVMPALGMPVGLVFRKERLQGLWVKIRPMLIGNAYCKSEVLIDRYLLSLGMAGDMSLYALGRQIYDGVGGIVSRTFAITAVPRLSIHYKQQDTDSFKQFAWQRMILLSAMALFGFLVFWLIGENLLVYFVGYGRMKVESIHQLWWIMILLGGTFVFGIVGSLQASAFYSIGDTRTPTYMSMVSLTLFIAVKIYAYHAFGLAGLAMATSVYFFINSLLMLLVFPATLRSKSGYV